MQRIKGITTGSLPTFVDVGASFASTAIEEDSIISQMRAENMSVVFMGDDTWVNLFPDSFTHSHPYDSFNVEDLHTVDNGVVEHLFPYLHPSNASSWDVIIGHFLGVDHVGHRVGPGAPTMKEKLQQMDDVLRRVVDLLDEDTLLVVLGDHGMDEQGNHGGDGELEVAAGLWMYSKGARLTASEQPGLAESLPRYTFPGTSTPMRHINQIDLVPTLALLLGIPIPFNNLGSIIPDCFFDRNMPRLESAMRVNAEQISRYIAEYGDEKIAHGLVGPEAIRQDAVSGVRTLCEIQANGGTMCRGEAELDDVLAESYRANQAYAASALKLLRGLWARFSVTLITLGLAILGLNIPMLILLYHGIRNLGPRWNEVAVFFIDSAVRVSVPSAALAAGCAFIYNGPTWNPRFILHSAAIGGVIAAEAGFAYAFVTSNKLPALSSLTLKRVVGPVLLILHAVSFASNSFIMWEDHMVVYLLNTITAVYLLKSLTHPTADMRLKVIALSLGFGVATRLLGSITVCREEQQPYCRVTFYSGSTPVAASWILMVIIPLALQLPRAIGMILAQSKSLGGPADSFLGKLWRGVLTLNALQWILEYTDGTTFLTGEGGRIVKIIRTWAARSSLIATMAVLPYKWLTSALCITVERGTEQDGSEKPVTVFGFANAFGSTYLLFLLIPFGLVHLVSPPMGQVALSILLLSVIAHTENIDTQRDSILMTSQFSQSGAPGAFEPGSGNSLVRPSFTDVVPLALLGFVGFFSTGHQAVLTTIQWKAAFVGFNTLTYPFAPLLVILNTWGPLILTALAVPLLAVWNVSPRPQGTVPILAHSMQLAIAFLIYHTTLTFASALFAAWLRRHLMVWKVFAPRFMMGAATLVLVDLAVMVAMTMGVRVTSWKVWRTFKCESV